MERAYSIQFMCLLLATSLVFTAGLWIHSFIVAVGIIDSWKKRPMTAADQILFSVGLSRLIFQLSCLGDLFCTIIHQTVFQISLTHEAVRSLVMLSNYCSLWFCTLLSMMSFLKISNFNNVFISRLKSFVLKKIVHLIFAILPLSTLYTVLGSWWYHNDLLKLDENMKVNISEFVQLSLRMEMYYLVGNAFPFLISAMTTSLLLKNLCLHLTRMKGSNILETHLDTYYTAIKCTASCFVSYTLHIISSLFLMSYYFLVDIVVFHFVVNFFPAVHSAYLIYITTRLRHQFSRLAHLGRNCLSEKMSNKIPNSGLPNGPGLPVPPRCNENLPTGRGGHNQ